MSVPIRQSPPLLPELLTAHDVAAHLLVGDRTVRRWEARGILLAVRVGGVKRYRADDVRALIDPSNGETPAANRGFAQQSVGALDGAPSE